MHSMRWKLDQDLAISCQTMLRLRRVSGLPGDFAEREQCTQGKEKGKGVVEYTNSDQDAEVKAIRKAYEIKRVQEGAARVIKIWSLAYPLYFSMLLLRWCCGLVSWRGFIFLQVPFGVFAICLRWNRKRAHDLMGKHKAIGVVFQSGVWIMVSSVLSFGSFSMGSELMRHRMFLTTYLPASAFFTIVAYIPPDVYLPCCCFWNIMVWLLYHYAVGFLNIPCALYGVISTAFTYYIYKHLDYHAWNEFQATQALDKDRHFLQAMHDTLQGMLSSLFDASCTCDQSGAMLSSTPQLRDLLGDDEESGPALHLRELAASTVEADRLLHFLEQICQSGSHRAQAIQASLQAAPKPTSSREVKMFGILLPDRAGGPTDCRSKRIFIGLLGQGNSVSTLDACPPRSGDSQEVTETALPDEEDLDAPPFSAERLDLEDYAESNVGSLSYTKGHSSEAGTIPSRISKRLHRLQELATSADAYIQTDIDLLDQHVPATLVDASVQTGAHAFHHLFQCPRCSLPQPEQDLTREEACFKDWKSKNSGSHKIRLTSSKRVLPDFVETPDSTISAIFTQTIKTINARGRGCCRFHIILARLAHVLALHRSHNCRREFLPYSDWQCHHCKAMNEGDSSELEDEEGEPLCCSTCETERRLWQPSGSDSGAHADLDSDCARN